MGCLSLQPPAESAPRPALLADPRIAVRAVQSAVPTEPQYDGEQLGAGVWCSSWTWEVLVGELQARRAARVEGSR